MYRFLGMVLTSLVAVQCNIHTGPDLPGQVTGIDYYDTTACLLKARASDLYMPGSHYSPTANTVIAKCLESILREEMGRLKP